MASHTSASPVPTGTSNPANPGASAPSAVIEPCRDADQLRAYIDTYWRKGHVLARDEAMFRFTYMTRWVDRGVFPQGISVLGIYESGAKDSRLLGFLGSIVAPYPRPRSYWLALWHVLPELKGGGTGGKLLQRMQEIALTPDSTGTTGWIGTFGAGPEALPVYLKRGYCCRAARRWLFDPTKATGTSHPMPEALNTSERLVSAEWIEHRYAKHPIFSYDIVGDPGAQPSVFRTESNDWGIVTHCARLSESGDWQDDVMDQYLAGQARAKAKGVPYLMDAWAFECPGASKGAGGEGTGWSLAPDDVPSVFHPPQARGNVIYAVGRPFAVTHIHKGDCDQDRPN